MHAAPVAAAVALLATPPSPRIRPTRSRRARSSRAASRSRAAPPGCPTTCRPSPAPSRPATLARGAGRPAARRRSTCARRPRASTASTSSRLREGRIYGRAREADGPVAADAAAAVLRRAASQSISLDDDELIALDTARRIYTMDNALKDADAVQLDEPLGHAVLDRARLRAARRREGVVVVGHLAARGRELDRPGRQQDGGRRPARSRTSGGCARGGQRLTFWDPWLPLDESYEMCGPHRGRFKAVNLSASGSYVFVIGRRGDMFTRLYDFDISGHDPVFFELLVRGPARQGRRRADPAAGGALGRAAEDPGHDHRRRSRSTRSASTRPPHPARRGQARRPDRLLGARRRRPARGRLEVPRDRPAAHARKRLRNPRRDTSRRGLGAQRGPPLRRPPCDFNVYCSPARIRARTGATLRAAPRRRPAPAGARPRPRRRAAHAVRRDRGGREVHRGHGAGDP